MPDMRVAPPPGPADPPSLGAFLAAHGSVLWTWLVAVALVYAVQLGAGLGTPSMGLALSSAAIPAALVAAVPPAARRWAMVGVVAGVAVLALADALYHGYFGDYIPLTMARAAGQLWDVRAYGADLVAVGNAPAFLAVVVTAVGALALGRSAVPASRGRRPGLPLGVALLGATPSIGWAWVVGPGYADTQTGGFLHAHVVDARARLGELALAAEPTPGEMDRVLALVGPVDTPVGAPRGVTEDSPNDAWFARAAGSSVLLVQVEALNDWILDAVVGAEPVAPFMRSLAARGVRFTGVYDAVHLGQSSDADYLVMASQHPLERGAVSVLRTHGYATLSAHAHHPGFWNSQLRHRAYGFETSLFEDELGPGQTFGFGLTDGAFVRSALPAVERLPSPSLAWLITMTMHGPHDVEPASLATLPLGELRGTPLGNYLLKARHTDDAMRALLLALDRSGAIERTTVVLYGDHTESHGFEPADVRRLARVGDGPADLQRLDLDRVALVVVPPVAARTSATSVPDGGVASVGVRVATAGTLLDVAPTVLHLLGIGAPRAFLGRSLLPEAAGFAAQITGEVVGGGRMWTGAACYDRATRSARADSECDALRARARAQLEGSWIITRYGLSARLDRPRPATESFSGGIR
jgi:hypothetical protein